MKKALAFVLLTSILLRLWFALGYWAEKPLTHDANEYLELAASFNKTGTFAYAPKSTTQIESYGRAPGYPFWLSLLMRISPTIAWLRLAEALLNFFATYIFFLITRELFGLRAGIIAFIISSFYIPLIALAPVLLSENVWIVTVLLSYWVLLRSSNPQAPAYRTDLPAAFVLLACATLIRPGTVFLLPIYMVWIFRTKNWRFMAALTLFYIAILAPWQIHQYQKEGRFFFIASEGAVTFWTGTHPQYKGEGDLAVNPAVQKDYRALLKQHAHLEPAQREPIYTHQAFDNIAHHPGEYLFIEVKKLFYWILPLGPSIMSMSLLHKASAIVFYMPLLALAVLGFRRMPGNLQFFFGGIIICFTLMILIFFPQERFRIASLDPIFLIIASNELARIHHKASKA